MKVECCDGEIFDICDNTVKLSRTLTECQEMFGDAELGFLPKISAKIMHKIDDLCKIHDDYVNMDQDKMDELLKSRRTNDISEDDAAILHNMTHGEVFDLILAVNFLEIPILENLGCKRIACIIKNIREPDVIAKAFGFDLLQVTSDQLHKAAEEYEWAKDSIIELGKEYKLI